METEEQEEQAIEEESKPHTMDNRNELIDQLANELHDERDAEVVETVAVAEETEEEEEEQEQVDEQQDILVEGEKGEALIKLKVDGVEILMPLADAQAELQKRETGSERLQRATELQQQLNEQAMALAQQQTQVADPATEEVDDETLLNVSKEVVTDIVNGDEDAAAEKLASALKRQNGGAGPATAISEDSIVETVAQRVTSELQAKGLLKEAFDTFAEEYPDITSDDFSFNMADNLSDTVAAEHPDWSPIEIMRETGKQIRAFRGKEPDEKPEDTEVDPNLDTREEAHKARGKLVRMPKGGSVAQINKSDESGEPQSLESVVTEMNVTRRGRAALGLAS